MSRLAGVLRSPDRKVAEHCLISWERGGQQCLALADITKGLEMDYRGVEYRVRRTFCPNGWKWSVKFGDSEKAGTFPEREGAVRLAQQFIDQLIGAPTPLNQSISFPP